LSKPLQINDLFWTLQGEGRWTGRRALFVRLPYCNYNCSWCDTAYDSFKPWTEEEFTTFAKQEPARFAVITGGEPLMHKDLPRIIRILKDLNFYIACETNGSYPAPDEIDYVTVSPKSFTQNKFPAYYIDAKIETVASEFKYVVDSNLDFAILKRHEPFREDVTYSLSPEFSAMKNNVQKIIEFIKENPTWKLSLQTHKWINIP
jgi:7-carboxy-7-deazaguanine synthase